MAHVVTLNRDTPLEAVELVEVGSALLFGDLNPETLMQPPVEATAKEVESGALPLAALPVIASIAAIAHPKDYNMFPARNVASALWDDGERDELALIEVLALSVGTQLVSRPALVEERQLLGVFEGRGDRFHATAFAFEALGAGDEEAIAVLRAGSELTRSPSLAWLEEACARLQRDGARVRQLRPILDERLRPFERGRELSWLVAFGRKEIGDDLPPWNTDDRGPTSMHGFMHYVLMAYRQLRGLELLTEWLPIFSRALSKGVA